MLCNSLHNPHEAEQEQSSATQLPNAPERHRSSPPHPTHWELPPVPLVKYRLATGSNTPAVAFFAYLRC